MPGVRKKKNGVGVSQICNFSLKEPLLALKAKLEKKPITEVVMHCFNFVGIIGKGQMHKWALLVSKTSLLTLQRWMCYDTAFSPFLIAWVTHLLSQDLTLCLKQTLIQISGWTSLRALCQNINTGLFKGTHPWTAVQSCNAWGPLAFCMCNPTLVFVFLKSSTSASSACHNYSPTPNFQIADFWDLLGILHHSCWEMSLQSALWSHSLVTVLPGHPLADTKPLNPGFGAVKWQQTLWWWNTVPFWKGGHVLEEQLKALPRKRHIGLCWMVPSCWCSGTMKSWAEGWAGKIEERT